MQRRTARLLSSWYTFSMICFLICHHPAEPADSNACASGYTRECGGGITEHCVDYSGAGNCKCCPDSTTSPTTTTPALTTTTTTPATTTTTSAPITTTSAPITTASAPLTTTSATITTTPAPTATSESGTCNCQCSRLSRYYTSPYDNMTNEERDIAIAEKTKEIQEDLKVPVEDLSATIRRKISVQDDRPVSKAIGMVLGVSVMVVVFGSIIISDLRILFQQIRLNLERNWRERSGL